MWGGILCGRLEVCYLYRNYSQRHGDYVTNKVNVIQSQTFATHERLKDKILGLDIRFRALIIPRLGANVLSSKTVGFLLNLLKFILLCAYAITISILICGSLLEIENPSGKNIGWINGRRLSST